MLRQDIPFRKAAFILSGIAVVQFFVQMNLLTRGIEYAAASLVIDDTYYYLQTAWNAKTLGFVTFDGLHPTNGVQLLWFVIIFLLATLAKSKAVLLFATLAATFLLNALCYAVILRIGAVLKQPVLMLVMASFWALQVLPFRIYSMGMENSLHALVYWCVIWQSVDFLIRVQKKIQPNFWGLTIVLILNAWTRLDSALLSAILFAFCMGTLAYRERHNLKLLWARHVKVIAGSSILAVTGLIIQLTAFRMMGGSFLPVSALIKTSSAGRGGDIESMEKFVGLFTLGMPSILQRYFPDLVLLVLGISGILLVILAAIAIREYSDEVRAFLALWSCLLVGETVYHFYIVFSDVEFSSYFVWYRSPTFIFGITTIALLARFAFALLQLAVKRRPPVLIWAPAGLCVAIFAATTYTFARSIDFTSDLYAARYKAALWMAENSSPDTVFASWNAGQLAYFSNRTVINLDGVINSLDYFERVLQGPVPLSEYLVENNVDYIVDYAIYHPIPNYPVEQMFPINDETGQTIYIWQVSPQISPVNDEGTADGH